MRIEQTTITSYSLISRVPLSRLCHLFVPPLLAFAMIAFTRSGLSKAILAAPLVLERFETAANVSPSSSTSELPDHLDDDLFHLLTAPNLVSAENKRSTYGTGSAKTLNSCGKNAPRCGLLIGSHGTRVL